MLYNAKTIAIVGLSANALRASYFVGFYLKRHGYRVIPVNPRESEILGEKSYPSLKDIGVPIDVVNVFRAPAAVPELAREAVAIGAGNLWTQFTVVSPEGARIAEEGGVSVVMDRCIEGGARPLRRPHALARVQHPPNHLGSGRTSIAVSPCGNLVELLI